MNKHAKRIPIYVILALIAVFLIGWAITLIQCEILTIKYHDDFAEAYKNNDEITDVEYFKVISHSNVAPLYYHGEGEFIEVFYGNDDGGKTLVFELRNGDWVEIGLGNLNLKNERIWPYWWNFVAGIGSHGASYHYYNFK